MEGRYVCFGFQSMNVITNDSNQLIFFWMSYSSINQKGMQDYMAFLEWQYFKLECQNLVKNIK
jgi:hypothetical protein